LVEKELAAHRIEATPEYSKVVLEPLRVIQDSTERLIAKYKLDRDRVIDAMAEADPAAQTDLVADVAAGMNELDRMRFYQMVDDFSQVLMKREQLRTNAEAAWREIEASRAAQSEQFRKQTEHQWKDNAEKIWDKLKSKIPGFESLPKIDEVRATVFDPANAQQAIDMQVYSLAAAHLVPRLAKTLESRQSRIEELEAALAKYKSATPSAGAGGTTDSSDEDPSADFLSSLEKRFR
jgi:hypothetical protein